MKFKLMTLVLCVSIISFAQTASQGKSDSSKPQAPTAGQAEASVGCPCCKHMADAKDAKPCCHSETAGKDGKDGTGCCKGKDAMSCMRHDATKAGEVECGSCCASGDEKACCSKSKDSDQGAMACCGGATGDHCGMQHHHDDTGK